MLPMAHFQMSIVVILSEAHFYKMQVSSGGYIGLKYSPSGLAETFLDLFLSNPFSFFHYSLTALPASFGFFFLIPSQAFLPINLLQV